MIRVQRLRAVLAMIAVLVFGLTACATDPVGQATGSEGAGQSEAGSEAAAADGSSEGGDADTLRIAFFASSSQNGYNQAVYRGVQDAAKEAGSVETEIFDGEFNADVQFNQIEDAVASGRFDGFVVVPNDTVGIKPVIEDARKEDIAVGSALFPIGPDLNTLEPQVDGIVTAAAPVAPQSKELAEGVVDYCEDKDPCRVVIMMGQLQFPFDNARHKAMIGVLKQHDNIKILATGEGNYDRDQSLTAMQDIIQANGEFDVLLSNADQHVAGALIALEESGASIEQMYIAGGGATKEAIDGIKAGTWDATATNFPYSEGLLSATEVVKAARGEEYEQVIDMTEAGPLSEAVITTETLKENPDFEPEWEG